MRLTLVTMLGVLLFMPTVQTKTAPVTFVSALDSDQVIPAVSRNADQLHPIASLTKLMTAWTLLSPQSSPIAWQELITIRRSDALNASWTHLHVGDVVSRGDLFTLMLATSDNIAARALGRQTAYFMQLMNIRALDDLDFNPPANFVEPAGLSAENQASPHELARLVQLLAASQQSSYLRAISASPSVSVQINDRLVTFPATDKLTGDKDLDIILGKTGYTEAAGYCFAGALQPTPGGKPVVVVVLGASSSAERFSLAKTLSKRAQSFLH